MNTLNNMVSASSPCPLALVLCQLFALSLIHSPNRPHYNPCYSNIFYPLHYIDFDFSAFLCSPPPLVGAKYALHATLNVFLCVTDLYCGVVWGPGAHV